MRLVRWAGFYAGEVAAWLTGWQVSRAVPDELGSWSLVVAFAVALVLAVAVSLAVRPWG